MKQFLCYYLIILCSCMVFKVETEVINTIEYDNTTCNGTIKVFGDNHTQSIHTFSHKLERRQRTKRRIRYRTKNNKFLSFNYAKVEGDCLWAIYSKPPNRGGENMICGRPTTFTSSFNIQSVYL